MADEEGLLLVIQIGGPPPRMLQKQILNGTVTDLLELDQQRGREVEGGVIPWKPVQEKDHVEIRFGGMHTHPRHAGRPRDGIGVIGLMHMPKKTDSNSFHGQAEKECCGLLRTHKEYVIGIPTLQSREQNGKGVRAAVCRSY